MEGATPGCGQVSKIWVSETIYPVYYRGDGVGFPVTTLSMLARTPEPMAQIISETSFPTYLYWFELILQPSKNLIFRMNSSDNSLRRLAALSSVIRASNGMRPAVTSMISAISTSHSYLSHPETVMAPSTSNSSLAMPRSSTHGSTSDRRRSLVVMVDKLQVKAI